MAGVCRHLASGEVGFSGGRTELPIPTGREGICALPLGTRLRCMSSDCFTVAGVYRHLTSGEAGLPEGRAELPVPLGRSGTRALLLGA